MSFLLNLVYTAARRNLWTGYSTSLNATDTTYDMRYNLLWNIGGKSSRDGGPLVREGVRANVYRNYFKAKDGLSVNAQKREIIACKPSGTASEDASTVHAAPPPLAAGCQLAHEPLENRSQRGHWLPSIARRGAAKRLAISSPGLRPMAVR